MNLNQLLKSSFGSLIRHKLRTLLTTLGIIIGIVSIIAVSAIGQGAKARIRQRIESLGTNFIIVLGGETKRLTQRRSGAAQLTLKNNDLRAIMDECDAVAHISPGIQTPVKCVYEGKNWQTIMGGTLPNYLEIRAWELTSGTFFSVRDQISGNKVVVLGQTVARELFGTEDPIGKKMRINKIPFEVIGVLSAQGKRPDGFDEDDVIMSPLSVVQKKIKGVRNKFGALIASAISEKQIDRAASQIRGVLRQQHNLTGDQEDDFTIFTQNDIAEASDAATAVLNLLLVIIASIALIVGGIGIMNIMLVTVTERKREIGVRMALGATTGAILRQFIFEAITMCLMGGGVGIVTGLAIAKTIGLISGWPIFVSLTSILVSLFSSTFIGIFFGFYPAYQASQLNPVDALLEP